MGVYGTRGVKVLSPEEKDKLDTKPRKYGDTNLSIYEIENIISKSNEFNYVKNFVAFNVIGASDNLRIGHECDVLVCSKAGYLTEIEIKRSFTDFLADFEKEHDHSSDIIKSFYYCIPLKIKDKVLEHIKNKPEGTTDHRFDAGILVYTEDGELSTVTLPKPNWYAHKLFIEQKMELMRLEAMRNVKLKEKIIKLTKHPEEKNSAEDENLTIN